MTSLGRRLLAGAALTTALTTGAGCGVVTVHAGVTTTPPSPTAGAATGAGAMGSAVPVATEPRAFTRGMTGYCKTFYTQQRNTDDRFPGTTQASAVSFAQAQVATARSTEARLKGLTPAPAARSTFAAFVSNAQQILDDRITALQLIESTGRDDAVRSQLNADFAARWQLATQLGATLCDGQLPADQQTAVTEAVRAFETSSDSSQVCRTLTTRTFLTSVWPEYADPVDGCIDQREAARNSPVGLPDDIRMRSISGVEHLGATATFAVIGGCGCPDNALVLHFVDGRWRISQRQ